MMMRFHNFSLNDDMRINMVLVDTCHMTPSQGLPGTSMSSKSPGRNMEEKLSLEMLDP